jgi:hypothetical protein
MFVLECKLLFRIASISKDLRGGRGMVPNLNLEQGSWAPRIACTSFSRLSSELPEPNAAKSISQSEIYVFNGTDPNEKDLIYRKRKEMVNYILL